MGALGNLNVKTINSITDTVNSANSYYDAIDKLVAAGTFSYQRAKGIVSQIWPNRVSIDFPGRKSTRTGDSLMKRGRVDGDSALINAVQKRPVRVSCGPSIAVDNSAIMKELLNRSTSVTVSGGYHYVAGIDQRAWHMQHFRHNAYLPAVAGTNLDEYSYQELPVGTSDNQIQLITPVADSSTFGPTRSTAYKEVSVSQSGGYDQYAPFSIVDLENISYNIQKGKDFIKPGRYNSPVDTPYHYTWATNPLLEAKNKFASRSLIFENNQQVNTNYDDVPAVEGGANRIPVGEHDIVCKPVLKGGKVEYLFQNGESFPASVTIIVYKVKRTYKATNTEGVFRQSQLKDEMLKDVVQSYLNKGNKVRLKTMEGREPVPADVSTNTDFQLLPNNKSVAPAGNPFVEQHRYNFVIAAGATQKYEVSLPGRMYNPCAQDNTSAFIQTAATNAIGENEQDGTRAGDLSSASRNAQFWSGDQYSIAVGVGGCQSLMKYNNSAVAIVEGEGTTECSVTCRVRYTERIGSMNMAMKNKPIIARSTFDHPVKGQGTTQSAVAVVPLQGAVHTTASGQIQLAS